MGGIKRSRRPQKGRRLELPTAVFRLDHRRSADGPGQRADQKQDPDRYRNFNGRLDELAVIGRALSDAELLGIYQAGKP